MWALRKLLRTGWGRTLLSSRGLAVGGEVGIQSWGLSVMRGAELASALPERADGAAGAEEGRCALGHPVLAPAPLPVCFVTSGFSTLRLSPPPSASSPGSSLAGMFPPVPGTECQGSEEGVLI